LANAAQARPLVLKLTLHDTIQPISAAYLERGLAEAARRHAALVLVSLDTPGGLLDSTRTMVAAIERSSVPVAIYVSPTGARAASAGFFLLQAADVAAMAPGTNAGAAHPVLSGGMQEGRTLDPILKQKIENDAAAFLRSATTPRNRNSQAAERAVRNSVSYSATEALNLHLIDFIEPSDAALLAALDGRTLQRFDGTTITLHLRGAAITELAPSLRERLLTRLTNPDLAVLLLFAGVLLIYLEFNVPGTVVPGCLGALSVLLALFGLGLLPLHLASVFLVLAGLALLLVEVKIPSHGILSLAGILALIFGLATLVDTAAPDLPDQMRVHTAVAIAVGASFGIVSFLLASIAFRARRNKFLLGPEAMLGRIAIARTVLAPTGQVEVRGELWQATLSGATYAPPGTEVTVRALDGLTLLVELA
jgi:membrane-bound serine protease (ClpP class)